MVTKGKGTTRKNTKGIERPTSSQVATRGISTGEDFCSFMSALMSDLIEGRVAPNIGNAACNAAGKMLRVVELQMRYGTQTDDGTKVLRLAMKQPLIGSATTQ